MSKVFLALQAVDETRAIIEAIQEDNENVEVEPQPAMVKISAEKKMVVYILVNQGKMMDKKPLIQWFIQKKKFKESEKQPLNLL